ncbi:MAG: response regulator [Dehalococcoidia bacterium]
MTDNTGAPIRVVLADDHELVLEGLRTLLENEEGIKVVATATDGERLLDALHRFQPDLVVLDLEMPFMGGLTCLEHIRRQGIPVRVLVLTAFGDGESILAAIEGGADGFALKTDPPTQTVTAIRQVAAGQLVFPQAARKWLGERRPPSDASKVLSEREWEVLAIAAEGLSNVQIASKLMVTEHTVKFHLQNIFQKLGVTNRTEAARYYLRKDTPRNRPPRRRTSQKIISR